MDISRRILTDGAADCMGQVTALMASLEATLRVRLEEHRVYH